VSFLARGFFNGKCFPGEVNKRLSFSDNLNKNGIRRSGQLREQAKFDFIDEIDSEG